MIDTDRIRAASAELSWICTRAETRRRFDLCSRRKDGMNPSMSTTTNVLNSLTCRRIPSTSIGQITTNAQPATFPRLVCPKLSPTQAYASLLPCCGLVVGIASINGVAAITRRLGASMMALVVRTDSRIRTPAN
jgi:hypothetical protein